MKTGLVKVQRYVGHTQQRTLWNICVTSPTTLRLNCLLFQWHWSTKMPIIIIYSAAVKNTYSATLCYVHFYHVMLIMFAATNLLFDWLKSWLCNELSRNKLLLERDVSQRDVTQRVVAATSSRCNELFRNELSATRCCAMSWSQRVVVSPFDSSSKTIMLELDEVYAATELASSCQALTMHVEGLPDSCWNCLS